MTDVLSLTTTAWRSFYESQLTALAEQHVSVKTLEPPNEFRAFDDDVIRRSVLDYVRFQFALERAALDGYDLVHANYGLTAPSALAQPIRPVVVTLWGGEFIGNSFARIIRAAVGRADHVIVPSEAMARRLDRDSHVIPFPVDAEQFRPIPQEEARAEVGWETDEYIVLFPSAKARYEKNYPLAERVVASLPFDVSLRAVSNEPYEDMPYYLNASDAVLITSRWESGPMVAKEAVACNVPVVSLPVGFVPPLLADVRNSAVAEDRDDLSDALTSILRDGGRSDGRPAVAAYDHAAMGEALCEVYDQALSR